MKKGTLLKGITILLIGLFPSFAFSASISKVNGKKALILLEGLAVSPGTELFALNAEQKRRAVIRITQVRGDKAIGNVINGAAQPGMVLIMKGSTPAPSVVPSYSDTGNRRDRDFLNRRQFTKGWGILGGMAMSSMAFTAKNSQGSADLALAGNSFNFKGIYDHTMSPSFTVRGATGLETLSVTGSSNGSAFCSGSASCSLGINYLTFEGSAQFNLTNSGSRFWIGGGFAFLLAMSKNTNISTLEVAGTNQVMFFSTGADIGIGRKNYIPITVEYGLYPFAGVKLSGIYARAGYGWKF